MNANQSIPTMKIAVFCSQAQNITYFPTFTSAWRHQGESISVRCVSRPGPRVREQICRGLRGLRKNVPLQQNTFATGHHCWGNLNGSVTPFFKISLFRTLASIVFGSVKLAVSKLCFLSAQHTPGTEVSVGVQNKEGKFSPLKR